MIISSAQREKFSVPVTSQLAQFSSEGAHKVSWQCDWGKNLSLKDQKIVGAMQFPCRQRNFTAIGQVHTQEGGKLEWQILNNFTWRTILQSFVDEHLPMRHREDPPPPLTASYYDQEKKKKKSLCSTDCKHGKIYLEKGKSGWAFDLAT